MDKKTVTAISLIAVGGLILFSKSASASGSRDVVSNPTLKNPAVLNPSDFIKLYMPLAQRYNGNGSIPAAFNIAQGGIESGWGTSRKFMYYNNVFGIRSGGSWTGPTDGHGFRAYDSVADSFADHERILTRDPRYKQVFLDPLNAGDPIAFARMIAPVYTPDAGYADHLVAAIKIIEPYIS